MNSLTRLFTRLALAIGLVASPWLARAAELDLAGYQRADGAITVHRDGDFVDPYFALKALLAARELGLDVTGPARRWIDWMLARPTREGLFGRYCADADGVWNQCQEADADDSLLALWLELLYVAAPDGGLPPAWQDSATRSRAALDKLYDPRLGGYVISPTLHVALLMDNCEVVGALRTVAARLEVMGDAAGARRLRRQTGQAERRLVRLFPAKADGLLRHTSEAEGSDAFYPHLVAQLYPALHGLPSLLNKPAIGYREWMRRYRHAWLTLAVDDYPWGLVAQVAEQQGDTATVACWVRQAAPLRHGARWHVLEEALWQGLSIHVDPDTPCSLH